MNSASLELLHDDGSLVATITFRTLPRTPHDPPPLIVQDDAAPLEKVQLLEGRDYLYEIDSPAPITDLEPAELFEPDDATRLRGRLRSGLAVGRVTAKMTDVNGRTGIGRFEVRSRKLDYLSQYRWMLRDIAEIVAEAVMERFAASQQAFTTLESADARTTYQRFVFLQSLLSGDEFLSAYSQITGRPYVSWEEIQEVRRPSQGVRTSSRVARQITRPGPRQQWPGGSVDSLPARLSLTRTEATVDNIPNQFVRFALTRWRDVIVEVHHALAQETRSSPADRGLLEAEAMLHQLDTMLTEPLLREVGDLRHFPAGNQVLQKRAGYRDVFRAYILFEVASTLAWPGGEDVYFAGQRDVATLYEYWAFFQMAQLIGTLCGRPLDLSSLLESSSNGLVLGLRQGKGTVLKSETERLDRRIDIEVWFNKTFSVSREGSWTRPMRPDISIRLTARDDPVASPVWLHFDAKYRVEQVTELFGPKPESTEKDLQVIDESEDAEKRGVPKRTDLLKMHAYRDAIRRSAGAFVLYPGDTQERSAEYHEILPGLGAFDLKPNPAGPAEGMQGLSLFLNDVVVHFASQTSQHERARYWSHRAYSEGSPGSAVGATQYLMEPPADTIVLLGFVRSAAQLEWIRRTGRYNVRAGDRRGAVPLGSRELAARFVILFNDQGLDLIEIYRISGLPEIAAQEDMRRTGYPNPRGAAYFCLPLEGPLPLPEDLKLDRLIASRRRARPQALTGEPVGITWLDLIQPRAATSSTSTSQS